MVNALVKALAALALVGCAPELADTTSIVDGPRVLAIRSEPAEVTPGATIAISTLATTDVTWSVCSTSKPLTEPGTIDPSCLGTDGIAATSLAIPAKACELFGPDLTTGRPVDPDGTGGYYQPIVAHFDGDTAVGFTRITCNLVGATPEQARQYRERTKPNRNPKIVHAALDGDALSVEWEEPESYVYFDPIERALVDRREAIRVSWFATSGRFSTGHTGRTESDPERTSVNTWISDGESATLWIVVRDDRGGVDWTSLTAPPL